MKKISTLLALAVMVSASTVMAADIGDKAPKLEGLQCQTGKTHALTDLKEKAVVVVFTCNRCPVAIDFEDSLINFAKDYKGKDVKLIAVNTNSSETADAAKSRAEEKGFNFPYLKDTNEEWAKAFGAKVTPHVFILDGDRQIVYAGAFADSAENPEHSYARDAVDAVLAGKEVETKTSKAFGCGINWSKSK
jgi:peroxiredoxin